MSEHEFYLHTIFVYGVSPNERVEYLFILISLLLPTAFFMCVCALCLDWTTNYIVFLKKISDRDDETFP